jgi:hypothetical protein
MKSLKSIVIGTGTLMLGAVIFGGCASQEQSWSHFKSSWTGLDRKITLYGEDGRPIREWKGRYNMEVEGPSARFMHEGKAVHISGTFVIEEL